MTIQSLKTTFRPLNLQEQKAGSEKIHRDKNVVVDTNVDVQRE